MDQKEIEKIVQYLKNIEPDVIWVEVRFSTNKTRGEIFFVRDNENNEFKWVLTNLRPKDLQ